MAHPAISGDLWSCFYLVADMQISYVCGSKTISSASNNAISINFAKQLIRLNELENCCLMAHLVSYSLIQRLQTDRY